MASPPSTTKSSSRWGSFLQQAVAGVESRLDTILADDDIPSKDSKTPEPAKKEPLKTPAAAKVQREDLARSRSSSKNNDRLQERLAKAIIHRTATRTNDNSVSSSNLPSRTASPTNGVGSPRVSLDIKAERRGSSLTESFQESGLQSDDVTKPNHKEGRSGSGPEGQPEEEGSTTIYSPLEISLDTSARPSLDSCDSFSKSPSSDMEQRITRIDAVGSAVGNANTVSKTQQQYEDTMTQMQSNYEASESRRQEEIDLYLERIDSLQSKLQYLAKETAVTASRAASEGVLGSMDQKLAAKEEKIALLMKEGEKLSQTELRHLDTIKKMRAKAREDGKKLVDATKKSERFERLVYELQENIRRAEAAEARATEKLRNLPIIEQELESLKLKHVHNTLTIEHLQSRISEATAMVEAGKQRAEADSLKAKRTLTAALQNHASNTKMELESNDERHRTEVRTLEEKLARDRERARVAEMGMRGEQAILEGRMEALRACAEEMSTGSTGDAQAKLLRQVETLQNQYAFASENWQGIETSLLARVAGLEKERDEIARRESEARRKARETNIKSRRLDEELEKMLEKSQRTEQALSERNTQLDLTIQKLTKVEAEVTNTRAELCAEREVWDIRLAQRLEAEKTRLYEETGPTPEDLYRQFRAESPILSHRKGNFTECASPSSRRAPRQLSFADAALPTSDRAQSRRVSGQPLRSAGFVSPYRNDSLLSINGGASETPSTHAEQHEDFFDGVGIPVTPERTINDMISVSTAAAGPSVQLVERMSAAVRRLESEKAASKDELNRLSAQRDEAREQVVSLMREIEEKRAWDERSRALETEIAQLNVRYQTTLEMLGEKSELVEELRADVADVKKIYRELIDSTMR